MLELREKIHNLIIHRKYLNNNIQGTCAISQWGIDEEKAPAQNLPLLRQKE
jgi:hypothetical protein